MLANQPVGCHKTLVVSYELISTLVKSMKRLIHKRKGSRWQPLLSSKQESESISSFGPSRANLSIHPWVRESGSEDSLAVLYGLLLALAITSWLLIACPVDHREREEWAISLVVAAALPCRPLQSLGGRGTLHGSTFVRAPKLDVLWKISALSKCCRRMTY